jgi:hypothetical protein
MKKMGFFISLWAVMTICLLDSCASLQDATAIRTNRAGYNNLGTVEVNFYIYQPMHLIVRRNTRLIVPKEIIEEKATRLLAQKAKDTYSGDFEIINRNISSLSIGHFQIQKITATGEVIQKVPQVVRLPPKPPESPPQVVRPARPLTRSILELIGKSASETRKLQYYISSALTLDGRKGMATDINLDPYGQGVIQETNAREKIIFPKDTPGVLIPDTGPALPGGPRTLRICFDAKDEHTLTFNENPSDHRYYLASQPDRQYGQFTEYGGESYRVTFDGEIPYLYVRLDELTDDQPRIRQVPGRYVTPGFPAETYAPASAAEADPAAVLETVVPGRSLQPANPAVSQPPPAPAPQTPALPPAEDEDEELDLDALLGP